jgi:predicted ATPase
VGTADRSAAGDDVVTWIGSLVDRSLLRAEEAPDGEPRYLMLETVREFALEASGEAEAVRQRHAAYYLALTERAEPEVTRPAPARWLERLETEHGNLRAALAWAAHVGEDELILRLALAASRH